MTASSVPKSIVYFQVIRRSRSVTIISCKGSGAFNGYFDPASFTA